MSHLHPLLGFQSTVSFQCFLLQLSFPFVQVLLSSLSAATGVSSHHPLLEFFFKLLLAFGFEVRHPSVELPRSFFLVWKRCFSSTRVLQKSRARSNSAGLLFTSCCLAEALSLPVASTRSLIVSSSIATLSWARVLDRYRPFRDFPEKLEKLWLAGRGLMTVA